MVSICRAFNEGACSWRVFRRSLFQGGIKERCLSLLGILERNLSPGTTNPTLKRKEFRDLSLGVRYK